MKLIRVMSHADDPKIPEGLAVLYMDDNGFVGTNNGQPFTGQPTMYPEAQAVAISTAWNYMALFHPSLDEMPHKEVVGTEALSFFD